MATCQVGAEGALKREVARLWPDFRFAYSRPGFLTFKLPTNHGLRDDFDLGSVFARSYAFSLGKALGDTLAERTEATARLAAGMQFDHLHVFPRDRFAPGDHRFEPQLDAESLEVRQVLRDRLAPEILSANEVAPPARERDLVLDVAIVGPTEWWIGYHRARSRISRWPGGLQTIDMAEHIVSRAYLKMVEGLDWSRLPLKSGQVCAEIGCAPGGSCQALLERGMSVIGVDPAEVAESVLANPHFVHIRKRGHEVRRGEYHSVRWLFADLNVAPSYTLDTVESIVNHPTTHVRGMLLTLKLPEWQLSDELPTYLDRIRTWGFTSVRARQLQHNRQEVCVAAERP